MEQRQYFLIRRVAFLLQKVVFCFVVLLNESVLASEDRFNLEDSDAVVVALKINGRIGCANLYEYKSKINFGIGDCYGSHVPKSLMAYNKGISSEDFLVFKVIAGDVKELEVLSFAYHDNLASDTLLHGKIYLLFLRESGDNYTYHPCESVDYEKVKENIDKDLSELIKWVSENGWFNCPSLSTKYKQP